MVCSVGIRLIFLQFTSRCIDWYMQPLKAHPELFSFTCCGSLHTSCIHLDRPSFLSHTLVATPCLTHSGKPLHSTPSHPSLHCQPGVFHALTPSSIARRGCSFPYSWTVVRSMACQVVDLVLETTAWCIFSVQPGSVQVLGKSITTLSTSPLDHIQWTRFQSVACCVTCCVVTVTGFCFATAFWVEYPPPVLLVWRLSAHQWRRRLVSVSHAHKEKECSKSPACRLWHI